MMKSTSIALFAALPMVMSALGTTFAEPLMTGTTRHPASSVTAAVRTHAEQNDWLLLGESISEDGRFTVISLCLNETGQSVPAASACGNLTFFENNGMIEMAMTHPGNFARLAGDDSQRSRVDAAAIAFGEMIDLLPSLAARQPRPSWMECWEAGCP